MQQAGATLHRGARASHCRGLSLRPLVAEHRLQTRRLSSCGSRAQLLRGMWDLPRPGLEPVSPALAGRFSTTAPPGKPCFFFILNFLVPSDVFSFNNKHHFRIILDVHKNCEDDIRVPVFYTHFLLLVTSCISMVYFFYN